MSHRMLPLLTGAALSILAAFAPPTVDAAEPQKTVVLVHGAFADGSSWSEVIPRLQAAGLNVTSVQNPLTTLPEAVDATLRVLERQNGPTILVFSRQTLPIYDRTQFGPAAGAGGPGG